MIPAVVVTPNNKHEVDVCVTHYRKGDGSVHLSPEPTEIDLILCDQETGERLEWLEDMLCNDEWRRIEMMIEETMK